MANSLRVLPKLFAVETLVVLRSTLCFQTMNYIIYIYYIYIYIITTIYLYRPVFSSFEQVVNIPSCHWIIELPFIILDRFFGQKEIGLEHVVAFDASSYK